MVYFISNLVDENTFNSIYTKSIKPGQQSQKYNRLLVEGLIKNGISLKCLSAIPASKYILDKTFLKLKNTDKFIYQCLINIPFILNVFYIITSFIFSILNINKKDTCIIDCLSVNNGFGVLLAKKIKHFKTITLITDFPEFVTSSGLFNKMAYKIIKESDAYIVLTGEMYTRLNTTKPYCIVEGMSDIELKNYQESGGTREKTIVFAGSLDKANGIDKLVKAFIEIDNRDFVLEIYGNGNYDKELLEISNVYNNIKYFGVKENKYIVDRIKKVSLLVNPRPTDKEFTKYSFPSKTLEYMASGTPFITSKLIGIGREYDGYLNYFENTEVEGIKKGLTNCLENIGSLELKASKAREFVLNEKNNVVQSSKVVKLLGTI